MRSWYERCFEQPFLTNKYSETFSGISRPLVCATEKITQTSHQKILQDFPARDYHRRASVGRAGITQESAKGAGGKGARVINCHNFFFTPDRETRKIDHKTTEGTAERKMRQFATPAPCTPAPFRPF